MPKMWNVYESFQALLEAGPYHLAFEGFLLVWVIWLLVAAKSRPRPIKLTKKEEEQLLAEWTPEPLLSSAPDPEHPALNTRTVKGKLGHYVDLGSGPLLNLASHDYLRFSEHEGIETAALECLHQYGVGSCGPRGFYGTTEVHLALEQRLAEFFQCESCVLYSYGFSTMASAIPAYAKSGDVIFADEAVSFCIQRGLQASRSRIVYFRHNDSGHLQQLLEQQAIIDSKNPKKANATRRFLVVEGLYMNTGNICRLPELVELRHKYKLRLFIDESCAFGTLGPHGRGALDHFNIPMSEVDLIMGSLEYGGGSTGGFAAGTSFVVEHQRLNGLGYVFSASLPPLLAAAAKQMLEILEAEAKDLVPTLQHRASQLHSGLAVALPAKMCVSGSVISPIKHVAFKPSSGLTVKQQESALHRIVQEVEQRGVAVVVASLLRSKEVCPPPPSIRLVVNVRLTDAEITTAITAVADACAAVIEAEAL
ncbi:serine palmitoyltransferase 1 [Hyalella azteca]|uniref:Serine palmitoyltransferase 1 n=1 Tax=Hyalella azteca TaxID=294128 RepID=A0A8B7PI09_HYAAZ|nr:serine palmitoyltransferase 1 [Hyalella azteca]